MNRWTDQAPELDPRAAAAGRLLARVTAPAPLSAERRARIAEALRQPPQRAPARAWRSWAVVGALAVIAIAVIAPRHDGSEPPRTAVPPPPVASAPAPRAPAAATPVEPQPAPAARVPPQPPPPQPPPPPPPPPPPAPRQTVTLRDGEVVVDGRDGRVVVETPRAQIAVPAGGRARVVVSKDGVRVVSMKQALVVHWIASDARFDVAAGEIWTSELLEPPPEPAPPSLPPPAPLGDEARVFAEVLNARKTDPSGKTTLALLDAYEQQYPHGTFALEAQTVRIDALVRSGNWQGALAMLDRMAVEQLAQGVELQVLRGELRVRALRARDALADFDGAIPQAAGLVAERARYGRAVALAAAGNDGAARAALADYLVRFPSGRFAGAARAALKP